MTQKKRKRRMISFQQEKWLVKKEKATQEVITRGTQEMSIARETHSEEILIVKRMSIETQLTMNSISRQQMNWTLLMRRVKCLRLAVQWSLHTKESISLRLKWGLKSFLRQTWRVTNWRLLRTILIVIKVLSWQEAWSNFKELTMKMVIIKTLLRWFPIEIRLKAPILLPKFLIRMLQHTQKLHRCQ